MIDSKKIMSDIIVFMKYAKYLPELKRRETWQELITRNKNMHLKKFPNLKEEIEEAYSFVYSKKVLPSMRSLQFAGKPIELNQSRMFNCAYVPVDCTEVFSEIMFLLLGGTGVGFSVQNRHIKKLPEIRKPTKSRKYLVGDSIEGWSDAVKMLIKAYMCNGYMPKYDFRDIRPKGARLVTSGGKAPGPEPLKECLFHIQKILDRKENGQRLTSLEVHDIICYIADAVLAGGIRRAALISFFDIDDEEMLTCKYDNWWEQNPQRGRANNSAVCVRHKLTQESFFELFDKMEKSKSGDPGFILTNNPDWLFNPCQPKWATLLTPNGIKQFKDVSIGDKIWSEDGWVTITNKWSTGIKDVYRYKTSHWVNDGEFEGCPEFVGTSNHKIKQKGKLIEIDNAEEIDLFQNGKPDYSYRIVSKEYLGKEEVFDITVDGPSHTYWSGGCNVSNCSEASLHINFCNLVTINGGNIEDQEDFNERARAAAFISTLQASYTDFHYLRDVWRENTEKESLLGVSITGIANRKTLSLDFEMAAKTVKKENERVAKIIGINKSARCTLCKPEGTTSLVLGCASGIHGWHANFYIRRVRVGKNEAIYQYLRKHHPELVEDDFFRPQTNAIITIPIKAPEGSITREESPFELLERVKRLTKEWIKPGHRKGDNTHAVSCTISLKDDEWEPAGKWMWENRNFYNCISVLPFDGGTHIQAPFEEISEEKYNELCSHLTDVDLSRILEEDDETEHSQEISCAGGACELK